MSKCLGETSIKGEKKKRQEENTEKVFENIYTGLRMKTSWKLASLLW